MANGIKAKCDFCNKPATYDAKTTLGPWAYLCDEHFKQHAAANCTVGSKRHLYTRLDEKKSDGIPTKECSCCHRNLPVTEFYGYTDRNGVFRFRTECKACNLERRRK